jgi:hypothetical protein
MTTPYSIANKFKTPNSSQRNSYECLNSLRLPARLDAQQTAAFLGIRPHDIPVLVAIKLLHPLGRPSPNGQKYFATCELEELQSNREWLDKMTRAIATHWQLKNGTANKMHKLVTKQPGEPAPYVNEQT